MEKDVATFAKIYPNKISEFLKNQSNQIDDDINAEVALVGRSNVGKSSLINSLLNQRHAKVSKAPGKTNFLQFIHLPSISLSLVDCPGYGHANRSQKERKEWNKMMECYIAESK